MTRALLIGLALSTAASASATLVVIPLLRRAQVMDIPVERSLHRAPIPRGGGLAVVLATCVTVLLTPLLAWSLGLGGMTAVENLVAHGGVVALGASTILAFALLGLAEDLFCLTPGVRLSLQGGLGLALGAWTSLETGAPLRTVIVVAVCTTSLVNVTNFMDGANGLAGLHGLVTALWYLAVSLVLPVPGLWLVMVSVAGSCLGFLPFNTRQARVFLGDTGSYALGGAWSFAVAMCLACGAPTSTTVAPLLILVTDAGYTLWMRLRAGQRWYQPHRLHVYQRLVSAGWSHGIVSLVVAGVAAACSILTVPDLAAGHLTPAVIVCLPVLLVYLRLPSLVKAPDPFLRPGELG